MNVRLLAPVVAGSLLLAACGGGGDTADTTAVQNSDPTTDVVDGSAPDDGLPDFGYEGGNFIKIFQDNDLFSTLLEAVTEADLTDLLTGDQPLTFFAPANKAFDDLPDGVLEKLLKPENRETLLAILKYHVVEGSYRTLDFTKETFTSLEGSTIEAETFVTDDFTKLLMVNGRYAIFPNLEATNGTIHTITWIMVPPGVDLDAL